MSPALRVALVSLGCYGFLGGSLSVVTFASLLLIMVQRLYVLHRKDCLLTSELQSARSVRFTSEEGRK